MIKIKTRNTNLINYCCNKSYKISKIDLLINNLVILKSFDYYSDKACEVCGQNNLKYFVIRKNNKEIK